MKEDKFVEYKKSMKNLFLLLVFVVLTAAFGSIYGQQSVNISVYYGGFGNECSWEIVENLSGDVVLSGGPGASSSFSYNSPLSLNPGEYTFRAFDSEADGWSDPDGYYAITPSFGTATGNILFPTGSEQETSFTILSPNSVEVGVVEWLNPTSGAGLSANQSITVKYRNYGTTALSNPSFSYSINGGNSFTTELYAGSIAPGATVDYTFSQSANLANPGTYACVAAADKAGDTYSGNDTLEISIQSIAAITSYPYSVNFTNWPPANWQLTGGTNQWQQDPSNAALAKFSFWNGGNAILTTPPFSLPSPATLSFNWSSYFSPIALNDALYLEVSNNNGQAWQTIWSKEGIELFSNDGVTLAAPGSYASESVDLSSYAGSIVMFRFRGVSGYGHDVYIDDFLVSINPTYDLAITSLTSPEVNACNLGQNVPVTIAVKNLGAQMASNFSLSYSLNGVVVDTENFTSFLPAGATIQHTFSTPVDFSTLAQAEFDFSLSYGLDLNANNNQLTDVVVLNSTSISSFPASIDFESSTENYLAFLSNDQSNASVQPDGSNNQCLRFEGGNVSQLWIGSADPSATNATTPTQAWEINTPYHAEAYTCSIDATSLSSLELFFDLKQRYNSGKLNSWFRVLVNGTPIADIDGNNHFNPETSYNDTYVNRHYDLSAYAGTQFVLQFQTANKFSSSYSFPGDVAFVDNILLREIPPPDIALVELINPVTTCGLGNDEAVSFSLTNLGGESVSNFTVEVDIDGVNLISEVFTGILLPEDTLTYTLSNTLDLSAIDTYTFEMELILSGDVNTQNNAISTSIVNHSSPNVSINGLNSEFCLYEQAVTLQGSPTGGSFSGNGVENSVFYPINAGLGQHTIHYVYSDPLINCEVAVEQSVSVIGEEVSFTGLDENPELIDVLVVVNYNSFAPLEQSWQIVNESGTVILDSPTGNYNGFTYNGSIQLPVGEYYFIASDVPGNGWNNSYYEITPDLGEGTGVQTFTVLPFNVPTNQQIDTFQVGVPVEFCAIDTAIVLTGNPVGGTFSGPGISQNHFNPSLAGPGTHQISYTYESLNSCVATVTQEVTILETPQAFLGSDITVCNNNASIALAPLNGPQDGAYNWSNGSTNDTIWVDTNGTYSLTITGDNSCSTIDTIEVVFTTALELDLGNDLLLCEGSSLSILAPAGFDQYLWSTSETTSSITLSEAGSYALTVTSGQCTASDTVEVTSYVPETGVSNAYQTCPETALTIDANPSLSEYLWSTGESSSSITIAEVGNYSITVTDQNQCENIQDFAVSYFPLPEIDLGPDQIIEDTLVILNLGSAYSSVLWSTGATTSFISIDTEIYGEGVYEIWAQVSDQNNCSNSDTLTITVLESIVSHSISLSNGWSIISTYVNPENSSIVPLFSDIYSNLIIVKNTAGDVYWPGFNFDGIEVFNPLEGYQILMDQADVLTIEGSLIDPVSTPLSLPVNWSIIAYSRISAAPIVTLLNPIVNDMIIIKNSSGDVYWPDLGFDGIGLMQPGEGYQILMQQAATLTYPANSASFAPATAKSIPPLTAFEQVTPSGNSMTLGITAQAFSKQHYFPIEVGVFNSNQELVGSGVLLSSQEALAISLWGMDETHVPQNCLSPFESYTIQLYSQASNEYLNLTEVAYSKGDGQYEHNDWEIIEKLVISGRTPLEAPTMTLYPNPIHQAPVQLTMEIMESSKVNVEIVNVEGETLKQIIDDYYLSGKYHQVIDLNDLAAGSYFVILSSNQHRIVKSIVKQ